MSGTERPETAPSGRGAGGDLTGHRPGHGAAARQGSAHRPAGRLASGSPRPFRGRPQRHLLRGAAHPPRVLGDRARVGAHLWRRRHRHARRVDLGGERPRRGDPDGGGAAAHGGGTAGAHRGVDGAADGQPGRRPPAAARAVRGGRAPGARAGPAGGDLSSARSGVRALGRPRRSRGPRRRGHRPGHPGGAGGARRRGDPPPRRSRGLRQRAAPARRCGWLRPRHRRDVLQRCR